MEPSLYHVILRISSLTLALLLVFQSGLLNPVTRELSDNTISYVAGAIGASASVQPTELNMLSAQVTSLEKQLEAKEREIDARVGFVDESSSEQTTFIMSVILFILLTLIVMNYVMDYLRAHPANRQGNEKVA
jgi:hypothetical protein